MLFLLFLEFFYRWSLILRDYFFTSLFSGWGRAYLIRGNWIPKDPIWYHPAIRQKYIGPELDGNQLIIYLNYSTFDPTSHAFTSLFMIAKDFYHITNIKNVFQPWCVHVCELWSPSQSYCLAMCCRTCTCDPGDSGGIRWANLGFYGLPHRGNCFGNGF